MKNGWHILRDGSALTLTRHLPVRFDVEARTHLPRMGRLRLASQIRQDIWRALQSQRGFSPVVEVTAGEDNVGVRAGGRIEARRFDRVRLQGLISDVLDNPGNRQRWLRGSAEVRP